MPVHNGATYLRPAIESILGQSFANFEFIIIDDCSTDDTIEIINSYNDSRIILSSSKVRLKLAGALNLGMKMARGEFIARMDADDISEPDRLRYQYEFLIKNIDIGICGSWTRLFPKQFEKIQEYPTDKDKVHALSLFHSPFAHPSVMMRRTWFEQNNLQYDVSFYPTEDFDLWSRALYFFKGANLDKVLLRYRIHQQSLTGSDWSTMDEQAARITRRGLQSLNLAADEEAGRYHRKIAMVQIEQSRNELQRAARWLKDISEANHKTKVFDQSALNFIIDELWFRLCMHCTGTGMWPLFLFQHYRIGATTFTTYREIFILTVSCIKQYFLRKFA